MVSAVVREVFVPFMAFFNACAFVGCLVNLSWSTTKATQKAFVATHKMLFFVSPRKIFVNSDGLWMQ